LRKEAIRKVTVVDDGRGVIDEGKSILHHHHHHHHHYYYYHNHHHHHYYYYYYYYYHHHHHPQRTYSPRGVLLVIHEGSQGHQGDNGQNTGDDNGAMIGGGGEDLNLGGKGKT